MDERMEELGSSFFSDFLRNTCGRKSICFEQIFFFCAWIFKSWHIPKRKKKGVDFPAARGARGAFRGRDEKRQEKKRKEKGGKCRRSADQRPLKSKKKTINDSTRCLFAPRNQIFAEVLIFCFHPIFRFLNIHYIQIIR